MHLIGQFLMQAELGMAASVVARSADSKEARGFMSPYAIVGLIGAETDRERGEIRSLSVAALKEPLSTAFVPIPFYRGGTSEGSAAESVMNAIGHFIQFLLLLAPLSAK